jgi:c-di-GMP-related signal transduction protein
MEANEIEDIIKGEASLRYRLLRYLNSGAFGFASGIHSVRHALAILGEREIRRWVRLVAALGAGENNPSDLIFRPGPGSLLRIAWAQNSPWGI